MRENQPQQSIKRRKKITFFLIILLVILNIFIVSFIRYYEHFNKRVELESTLFFQNFNEYVLLVIESEGVINKELSQKYSELKEEYGRLSPKLINHIDFPEPNFTTKSEQIEYSGQIRNFAYALRSNLTSLINSSYGYISYMTVFSILFSLIILIFLLIDRRLFNYFIEGISSSLNNVENILIHGSQREIFISESNILEVSEMNNLINKISQEIYFNNHFLDYSTYGDLDLILNNILSLLEKRMPCDRIALAFIDEAGNLTAENALVKYTQTYLNPGYIEPIINTSLSDLLKTGQPRIINDLKKYSNEKKISHSTKLIIEEGINSSITVPMMSENRCLGFFFVSSCDKNSYDNEMAKFALRIINLSKQKLYIEYLFQKIISETSNSFVSLMEEKDNETSAHIVRMSQYSYIISRAYHEHVRPLTPRFMREILWYSPLHDIGKVGIPDSILLKEGPLDKTEMDIMKGHVNSGKRVMENMNFKLDRIVEFPIMKTAVDIVSGHHEKYNGKGYPLGLSGNDIPLAGRIVALADVFDALTSKRSYKEAFSIERALEIIDTTMEGSFDPEVLASFKIALPKIKTVYDDFKEV